MISFHDDDINHKVHNLDSGQWNQMAKKRRKSNKWYYGEWWMPLRESLSFNSIKIYLICLHINRKPLPAHHNSNGYLLLRIFQIKNTYYTLLKGTFFSARMVTLAMKHREKKNHFDSNAIHLRSIRCALNGQWFYHFKSCICFIFHCLNKMLNRRFTNIIHWLTEQFKRMRGEKATNSQFVRIQNMFFFVSNEITDDHKFYAKLICFHWSRPDDCTFIWFRKGNHTYTES